MGFNEFLSSIFGNKSARDMIFRSITRSSASSSVSSAQGGKRRCVQVDKRGSMIGRAKRQSGSEATKRPVFP